MLNKLLLLCTALLLFGATVAGSWGSDPGTVGRYQPVVIGGTWVVLDTATGKTFAGKPGEPSTWVQISKAIGE